MVNVTLQVHSDSIRCPEDTVLRLLPDKLRDMMDLFSFHQPHDRQLGISRPRHIHHIRHTSRQAHHSLHVLLLLYHLTARGWPWKLRHIKKMLHLHQSRLKEAHYCWHCPCIVVACLNPAELKQNMLVEQCMVLRLSSGIRNVIIHLLCSCAHRLDLCAQYLFIDCVVNECMCVKQRQLLVSWVYVEFTSMQGPLCELCDEHDIYHTVTRYHIWYISCSSHNSHRGPCMLVNST